MHIQPPDGVLPRARRHRKVARTQLQQFAAGNQTVEPGFQFGAAGALRAQLFDQLPESAARVWKAGDVIENRPVRHSPILQATDRRVATSSLQPEARMRLLTLVLVPAALLAGQSRFARLGEFQGQVEVQLTAADPWIPAERHLPLPELAWLRTGADRRVEIEMDDGSLWRLGPTSLGEISDYTRLSTGQRVTLLSLDRGTAYYTGQPASKNVTMLAMPGAQLTVLQGSRVRQTAQPGLSQAAILEGLVRFSSPAAEMDLRSEERRVGQE